MASSDGVIGLQPRLAGVAGFLDRYLLPLVLIVAALGVALPAPGRRLDADGAILITLAVLVFCTGSSVTFADIRGVRAAAGRLALVLAATTVVLPLLAWLASRLVSGAALQGGVLAAGVAPVEVASVALTGMAGGEVVMAAGLLIASTLLTVLLAGPILGLLGAHSAVSQLGLLSTLALVVALPLHRTVGQVDHLVRGAAEDGPGRSLRPREPITMTFDVVLLGVRDDLAGGVAECGRAGPRRGRPRPPGQRFDRRP